MKSALHLTFLFAILIFNTSSFAQTNYDAQWKKVNELIQKKNLPKSAMEEVKKIYNAAKKEGREGQYIKALVYMSVLQAGNRENNEIVSIREIEKEISQAKEPAASILKNYLATQYLSYLQNHRWQLYDRTNTVGFDKADIATWTADDLNNKISELYLNSLSNAKILRQTALTAYDPIISRGNARNLRPTLYDLLAHQALEYFMNDERDIKKPAYAFEIDQSQAFAPANEFINHKFMTKDPASLKQKALVLFQDLIRFHLNDEKPEALIDVDVARISFVYENSVREDKDSLYLSALRSVIKRYGTNANSRQAQFLIASFYNTKADEYQPLKDTANRYYRIKALDVVKAVVMDSAVKNEGWTNSYNLLQEIKKKSFSFQVENVNLPLQPLRALIKYRNIPALNFRIVKADEELAKAIEEGDEDKLWNALIRASAVTSWSQPLPATNDLQQHAVEVKIAPLPIGKYYLLASVDPRFSRKENPMGAGLFYVSNISYIRQDSRFFVLHRETGQPLPGATVELYHREYDYTSRKFKKTSLGSFRSDKNGFLDASLKTNTQGEYFADIRYQNDRLDIDQPMYYYNGDNDRIIQPLSHIFFFTDRSIYRPGQTVYFKSIVIRSERKNNSILAHYTTWIYLHDANGEIRDSIQLTTNEYGSFNGKFQLPQAVLNGNFTITDKTSESYCSFSVEEYKRPGFHVEFDKIVGSYKVNDSVLVTGIAKAYAGNNISEARVSYRIVRQPRFIYFFARWWQPPSEEMEIAHGETTTDKDGKFNIRFKAIPDKKLDPASDPFFDYQVYADITDISGETRSNNETITASYKSIVLHLNLDARAPIDSGLRSLSIVTENLNGNFQPAILNVRLFRLNPEQRLIRERYWEQPDQFVMDKKEYLSYFPHDEYKDETDQSTWPKTERSQWKDSARETGTFPLVRNNKLEPGFYAVEVTVRDRDGKEVKDIVYTEIYDPGSSGFSKPEYLWTRAPASAVEPGETASMTIGSSANNIYLIHQVDRPSLKGDSKPDIQFLPLNSEKKSLAYPVMENDRGGFGLGFFFVKDNRFYQSTETVNVPWSNKELKIGYETFRDKTLPGSEEKWKVKISGNKNEKLAAEVLASMYDASLDQFKEHNWQVPGIWSNYNEAPIWDLNDNFSSSGSMNKEASYGYRSFSESYDVLFFGDLISQNGFYRKLEDRVSGIDVSTTYDRQEIQKMRVTSGIGLFSSSDSTSYFEHDNNSSVRFSANYVMPGQKINIPTQEAPPIQPRKNFNETAFFFPELRTDENGSIEFSFTAPEALTKWKLQTLAHTKDLAFGFSKNEMITQKELMVQPNMPRFLRQGDHMELVAKIVNLSDTELTGQAQLLLFDAATQQSVDGWFMNTFPNQYFTVAAGESEVVKFPIQVPMQFSSSLEWRIVARTNPVKGKPEFSDGEEDALPVLSNKLLVTESLPLTMRGNGTRNFSFDKLLQSGQSETLQHHSLTVEYTSNPAWYAVQALPYLMEYPYECAEQTWNRYYANALATKIANSSPRLRQVFEKWKTADTAALLSHLQKNQELKSALLEETPWVLQAKTEQEQKKNIALLFDMVRMSHEMESNLSKLKGMQSSNGGFVWFKGGPDDRYITQYIVTGIGHLQKLGASSFEMNSITSRAIPYLDARLKEDYDILVKSKADLKKEQISSIQVQYLYMRSFFSTVPVPSGTQTAFNYYKKQAQQFWMKENKYLQGMIALALFRYKDALTPAAILKSLKETSLSSEELGMFWKENSFGYSWLWQYAPIETQSLIIEAFSEIGKDAKTVDDLKTWLIKNKQTNNWRTTKATADACYALLLQGANWLANEPLVQVRLGSTTLTNQNGEAGTGYFKQSIEEKNIEPSMGKISLTIQQPGNSASPSTTQAPSWGSVYWQYFEDIDKISAASTPLQLKKKLFIEKNTDRGPVLTPVEEGTELHVGDKIKVRIELRVDRDMDYVHMKDMRASSLEPVNVLSGYKWQDGLGYYESTRDASTNFFFSYLRKGTYVFEYPLFITHAGDFSNGITTIQCMYAPEFTAHSEGMRIMVEEK